MRKSFGPQRGVVRRYRQKKDEYVVEYDAFETSKPAAYDLDTVRGMLVKVKGPEDVEMPLKIGPDEVVVKSFTKKKEFDTMSISKPRGSRKRRSMRWLQLRLSRNMKASSDKDGDGKSANAARHRVDRGEYLVNRVVLNKRGEFSGRIAKFLPKLGVYVVKFANGVETRLRHDGLAPLLLPNTSSSSSRAKTKTSADVTDQDEHDVLLSVGDTEEDRVLNARFVRALQMLERTGFLRFVSRPPNHVAKLHMSTYLDTVQWNA